MKRGIKYLLFGLVAVALFSISISCDVYAFGSEKTYEVTFLYGGKSNVQEVFEGENAKIPTDTSIQGYTFLGWNGNANNIHSDVIILGMYTCNTPYASAINSTTTVKKINDSTSAAFMPWWNDAKGVPGKTCVIRWYTSLNSQPFKTDVVKYGDSLVDPENPVAEGYDFVGWEGSWKNVTEDRAIKAYFTKANDESAVLDEYSDNLYALIQ